jgi:hypothetical protein
MGAYGCLCRTLVEGMYVYHVAFGECSCVRVTLLVSLRDDSISRGTDSPCLMIIIVYSGSALYLFHSLIHLFTFLLT